MAVTNAATSSGLLNLERELQCFICTELLFQPLTLIDCLHTFCGACLKEWFGHQRRKASSSRSSSTSNPYTCPTCRATVKDARHNATVTTLLDMFLTANPDRGRSKEEEAEQRQIYKPGDDILTKVEPRRRREGRSRREEEEFEAQDRRLVEEARQRSLRDMDIRNPRNDRLDIPATAARRSSSQGQEQRRTRRREQERAERRWRVELAEQTHIRHRVPEVTEAATTPPVSRPQSSPRHPEAVEARQRDSVIAHQPSLISLMSASESSTGTGDSLNEARIMQEILAEGLLEGINVDELTEQEQDELSERIAEAYRQRHQRHGQASSLQTTTIANGAILHQSSENLTSLDSSREDRRSRQPRSHGHRSSSRGTSRSRDTSTSARRAARSTTPQLLDIADGGESPRLRAHRRRASDQSTRQSSPSRRMENLGSGGRPTARSSTDLSNAPSSDHGSPRHRSHQLSDNRRTNTEPQSTTRISNIWRKGGRDGVPPTGEPTSTTVLPVRPLTADAESVSASRDETGRWHRAVLVDPQMQPADDLQITTTTTFPQSQKSPLHAITRYQEPSISCARCLRPEIQYNVYKHCPTCKMELCLECYRSSHGCNHWYGFGKKSLANFMALRSSDPTSRIMDPPHVLVGRKYLEAPPETIQAPGVPMRSTTSNPAERLREGHFCDSCHAFANACFWSCEYCNEGEWGFCNDCVNTHKCCVHPLLPLAHTSFAPKSSSAQTSPYDPHVGNRPTTPAELHAAIVVSPEQSSPFTAGSGTEQRHDEHPDYVTLSFTTYCDICSMAIQPEDHRYHCPSHPSPTPGNPKKAGDYDICGPCYHQLADTGKIKRDDGPSGWRKCPGGHRMIVIAFEEDSHLQRRRIIQRDLVGGHLLDPKEMIGPRSRASSMSSTGSRFPPDGGFGKTYAAMWSYYPEKGMGGNGELMFPKWAEIHECEDQNEDWAYGVYMGNKGLLPRAYVREWNGPPNGR